MTKLLKPLACLALLGFPIALVLYRLGVISFSQSLKVMMATGVLAALVFLLSLLFGILKRSDRDAAKAANTALVIALIPLIGLGMQAFKGRSLPAIHNISTDVVDPPQFDKVLALRGANSNPIEYKVTELASVQQDAYPMVKTLKHSLSPVDVFARAVALVKEQGWELVNADQDNLTIEATETTTLWQFKDDVVIRIRASQNGSLIDMRSVSRIGRSDLGANAKRIELFLNKLTE